MGLSVLISFLLIYVRNIYFQASEMADTVIRLWFCSEGTIKTVEGGSYSVCGAEGSGLILFRDQSHANPERVTGRAVAGAPGRGHV